MTESNPAQQLGKQEIYWLTAGVGMSILPHALHTPVWLILCPFLLIVWRLGCAVWGWPLPASGNLGLRAIRIILMFAGVIGIHAYYQTLVGRDGGTALLLLLTGFKILESHVERDFYISTFLGLFIIITNFFYSQTLLTAVYMMITLLIIIAGLITFNDRKHTLKPGERISMAVQLLCQALPVMLILFLLFPRINGPLWGMPDDAIRGLTGVDDVMTPGSISRLIQSNDIAFRVEFKDADAPPKSSLYWRGPVLTYMDGRAWRRRLTNLDPPAKLQESADRIAYTITLEPTNQRWLYTLEMPSAIPDRAMLADAHQVLTRKPVKNRFRYAAISTQDYRLASSGPRELQRSLQMFRGFHPKTRALAEQWAREASTPAEVIARALRWFTEEHFIYTLSPPVLPGDPVDDFLFDTRQGFCEHYASAFAVIMRAAGIPARVVTGYQGGSYNPIGDYFIVYQRNAHAWTEVWLAEEGWVRIDPTTAVSPARVEQGIENALPDVVFDLPVVFSGNEFTRSLWRNLRNTWDNINNQWNQWVISYGPQRQDSLFKKIGLKRQELTKLILGIVGTIALMLAVISFGLFRHYRGTREPSRQLYDRFCRKLAKRGVRRLPHEGPLDFSRRAGRKLNRYAGRIAEITRLYIEVRYGSKSDKLTELKTSVKRFRPAAS